MQLCVVKRKMLTVVCCGAEVSANHMSKMDQVAGNAAGQTR